MASLLSYSTKDDVALYVKGVKSRGIELLPPKVEASLSYTAPTRMGQIRFGLEGIKDVGAAAEKIVTERKTNGAFKSFSDFLLRCYKIGVNKSAIEALIKAGALDSFITNRKETVENLTNYIAACRKYAGNEEMTEEFKLPEAVKFEEYDANEFLKNEREYVGYYTSGSPLDKHKDTIARYAHTDIVDLDEETKETTLVGLVTEFAIIHRKSDNKAMCKFVLEDPTGTIDTICFTKSYEKYKSQLSEGSIVYLTGKVKVASNEEINYEESEENKASVKFEFTITKAKKLA